VRAKTLARVKVFETEPEPAVCCTCDEATCEVHADEDSCEDDDA